jgi:MFS family permease
MNHGSTTDVTKPGAASGHARSGEDEGANPFGLRFTLSLMLGTTLNPINSSMIATGLAGIAADFRLGPGTAASLVSVLYLCSAVMQPTMGKLSTLFGPWRVFLAGVAILLAGGAVGGVAEDFMALLVSRALIGVGTSACYPAAMAMVRRRADRLKTGVPSKVLGDFSIASQVTVVFGLPVGGVLASAFGWRGLFWVNVPLAALALVSAVFNVEEDGPLPRGRLAAQVSAIDVPGIVLFGGAVVSLLVFLGALRHPAWWELGAAAALTAALVVRERQAASPLIDVRMLVLGIHRGSAVALLIVISSLFGFTNGLGNFATRQLSTLGRPVPQWRSRPGCTALSATSARSSPPG